MKQLDPRKDLPHGMQVIRGGRDEECMYVKDAGSTTSDGKGRALWLTERGMHISLAEHGSSSLCAAGWEPVQGTWSCDGLLHRK